MEGGHQRDSNKVIAEAGQLTSKNQVLRVETTEISVVESGRSTDRRSCRCHERGLERGPFRFSSVFITI